VEFIDVITQRRSVRRFQSKALDSERLRKILEAANCAPSAGNLQAYEIYVINDLAARKKLSEAALNQEFIAEAPVVLVFCALPTRSEWRYRQRGVQLYAIQDATIACTFAMLAATELGLGNVWVGAFDDQAVRLAIGATQDSHPIAILPIGYPAEEPRSSSRRRLEEFVHFL